MMAEISIGDFRSFKKAPHTGDSGIGSSKKNEIVLLYDLISKLCKYCPYSFKYKLT